MSLKKKLFPPFSLRCEADFNCLGCDLGDAANHKISKVPLWKPKSRNFKYYLASNKKATTNPMIFKNKLLEVKEQFYTREKFLQMVKNMGKKLL